MSADGEMVDLFVIGGGVNGAGIARDAAGRGLKVVLAEKDDLAQGTSSRSGKLVHGGLRYLEYYEFRLVREALIEREVLLESAPHIIWPMRFVLPHSPTDRPAWLVRLGLFLYDHLGGRKRLPGTRTPRPPHRAGRRRDQARLHPRLRVFRLLGGRRPPRRAERARRAREGRAHPDPHRLHLGPARGRRLDGGDAPRADRREVDRCAPRCWSTPPGPGSTTSSAGSRG